MFCKYCGALLRSDHETVCPDCGKSLTDAAQPTQFGGPGAPGKPWGAPPSTGFPPQPNEQHTISSTGSAGVSPPPPPVQTGAQSQPFGGGFVPPSPVSPFNSNDPPYGSRPLGQDMPTQMLSGPTPPKQTPPGRTQFNQPPPDRPQPFPRYFNDAPPSGVRNDRGSGNMPAPPPFPQPFAAPPPKKKSLAPVIISVVVAVVALCACGVLLLFFRPWESKGGSGGSATAGAELSSGSEIVPAGSSDTSPTNNGSTQQASYGMGNTAANIINSGLACEHDGYIYYQGNDGGIYRMNSDGSGVTSIRAGKCFYLNVMGEHIFYSDENDNFNIYRVAKTGGNRKLLCGDTCSYLYAFDGYLYYLNSDNSHIYRINSNGEDRLCLSTRECASFVIFDSRIYLLTKDSSLYSISLTGANESTVVSSGVIKLTVLNGSICFRYKYDNERLYRLVDDSGRISMLCDDLCHFPNSTGERLYYCAKDDGNALYHMQYDTGDARRLSGRHVYTMNIAGGWVFFRDAGDKYALYRMRLNGSETTRL